MREESPKVFISHSWESEPHKEWVLRLATDLRIKGVDVVLDRWHLKIGDDIAVFMDESVSNADYILLVCSPNYAEKSNARRGGVGYEQNIISGELLTETSTRAKFIPLLRAGNPSIALPRFLKSKLFVDFRDDDKYQPSLDQLLRHLFDASEHVPPMIGARPSFENTTEAPPLPHPQPRKWILVAGTARLSIFSEKLKDTAEELGRLLARNQFGLVTGGWPGVDDTAARAFAREISAKAYPLEDYLTQIVVDNEEKLPAFPAGNLVVVKDGSIEEWTEGIDRASAVILIGGIGGTWQTGEIALERGKPVFPLADTGDDAKKFYMHMIKFWDRVQIPNITKSQFQVAAREAPKVVADVISLLKQI
jgi:hypothetical protein